MITALRRPTTIPTRSHRKPRPRTSLAHQTDTSRTIPLSRQPLRDTKNRRWRHERAHETIDHKGSSKNRQDIGPTRLSVRRAVAAHLFKWLVFKSKDDSGLLGDDAAEVLYLMSELAVATNRNSMDPGSPSATQYWSTLPVQNGFRSQKNQPLTGVQNVPLLLPPSPPALLRNLALWATSPAIGAHFARLFLLAVAPLAIGPDP